MHRRHLLALAPAAAVSACTASPEDPDPAPDASDGGGAVDDGGQQTSSPSSKAPSAAELLLEELTPRELAGQLVLVGIGAGEAIEPELLSEHHAGGFFLLSVWDSAEAVEEAVASAQEGSRPDLPPLLAVDQEGGQVRMLRGDAARRTESAEELGAQGPQAVAAAYTSIGEDLAARGIDVALSPVADVVDPELDDANEPVGGLDRGFGTDPEHVGQCVEAAVEALSDTGTAATLKHFPGLGRVEQNTDHSAQGIIDDVTSAQDPFLASFTAGIEAGAGLVMLSSAIYPQLEDGVPAMFSSVVVEELLRGQLGFEGLVITDDIGAAVAVAEVPVAERATRALEAGGDAVLTADPSLTGQLVDALEDWAAGAPEHEQRLRESVGRMLALKERLGLL